MIGRSQVQLLAGVEGELSSPELTYLFVVLISEFLPPHYHSSPSKSPVILPKVQEANYN